VWRNKVDELLIAYDRGSYNFRIAYHQLVPLPKLSEVNQQWGDELLAQIRGA
jgi:hypothetical protein